MNIGPLFSTAQLGMARSEERLAGAAEAVAAGRLDPKDAVEVRTAEHSFAANALVLRTADEMTRSLLNVKT